MDLRKEINQLTVGDVCSRGVVTIDHYQSISHAAAIFEKYDITGAPIVDEVGKCIGMISSRDIVRFFSGANRETTHPIGVRTYQLLESEATLERTPIDNSFNRVNGYMTSAVQTVSADSKLHQAAEMMCMEHIHRLVVLDETRRPVGMLSSLDIVAALWNLRIFHDGREEEL